MRVDIEMNKNAVSPEQKATIALSQLLVKTALDLLKEAKVPADAVAPYIGEELIQAEKYVEYRNKEASRKRVSRLSKRIIRAETPEEAARIKAERYPGLTAKEIEAVERKLQKMQLDVVLGIEPF